MSKGFRAIAISPVPEQLCLAASCRSAWDRLWPAGARRVVFVLDEWTRLGGCREAIVLVPHVDDPEVVRAMLRSLSRTGTRLAWFAPRDSRSVARACKGVPNVRLATGDTLVDALASEFGREKVASGPARRLGQGDLDLADWLRFRCSLSLMCDLEPDPIVGAIDLLAKAGAAVPPKTDLPSVRRFREADFPYLEGQSPPLRALKQRVRQVGATELGTLVLGETGTGKEAVAFYLHEFSPRREKPFVALNCAGLDEALLRSELFGHEQGAFTGAVARKEGLVEQADGGTLFLDELGEMPIAVQADLLRFVQTRRFRRLGSNAEKRADVRIVAATQPDLRSRIDKGLFREDLYFRIAEVVIETPALREVPSSVPEVVRHLVHRLSERGAGPGQVQEQLAYFEAGSELLAAQRWPGNVREVAALVKRRVLLGDDVLAGLDRVPHESTPPVAVAGVAPAGIRPIDDVVRDYVRGVFAKRGGMTQGQVAERLGCSVNTLKKIVRS